MKRNDLTAFVRAACGLALFAPGPGWSQAAPAAPTAAPAAEPAVTMEAVTVTGTNIRRIEQETTLPVSIIDRNDLDLRSAPTAAELFDYLPSGGPITLNEGNILGADARGDNNALNLRGIGSGNTLVLINGRRMSPHPVSQAESQVPSLAVNANQLPTAALDRVEILRDGASAIYGADAAAGVVNAILRNDYEGLEFFGRGGLTEELGAEEWRLGFNGGDFYNGGRTHITYTADFYRREKLTRKDRDFSSDADGRRKRSQLPPAPWDGVPLAVGTSTVRDNDFDNRSSTSQFGNFVRGSFDATGAFFTGARPTGNRGITTSTTPSTTLTTSSSGVFFLVPLAAGGTGLRQSTPSRNLDSVERDYYYDLNIGRNLLPATDRFNFFARVEHELSDHLKAFAELGYYHSESETNRDPVGVDGTDDNNIHVGVDNPYNPFGSRFYHPTGAPNADGTPRVVGAPAVVLIQGGTGVRPREFPVRKIDVLSQAYRGVFGLAGRLNNKWDWESGALYSRSETRDTEHFSVRESLMKQALLRSDATAFNPFGFTFRNAGGLIQIDQPYTNPASVVDPLFDDFMRVSQTELASWDARISGPLVEFWNIPVSFAAGTEYRYETYSDWRPPFHGLNPPGSGLDPLDNDFLSLSPNLNLNSNRDVLSAHAELLVPFFGAHNRKPLFHALELSTAVRYEKFTGFGDATKPKVGLAWRPHRSLLLRASYNESFRAPNLVQTNTSPLQRAVTGISDPYRFEVTGDITDGATSRTVFRQGNAILDPETADTVTFGVALEVPYIKGLTLTADYWKLNQMEIIDTVGAGRQLQRDEALLDAFVQAAIAAGQNPNTLVTNSGAANYAGNSKVTRAPVTAADQAAFAAFNAGVPAAEQRAPVGAVISVIDDYINISGRDLEGYDLGLVYKLPPSGLGQFTLNGTATYMTRFDLQVEPGNEVETGLTEDGRAKLKGNLSLSWRRNQWSAGWFTNYLGSYMDPGGATTEAVYEALGRPKYIAVFNDVGGVVRYRYITERYITHNAHVNYGFGRRDDFLSEFSVRLGVNNVFDEDPSLNDDSNGYDQGNPRGRLYYAEFKKKF